MSETILDKLAAYAVERTEAAKSRVNTTEIKKMAFDLEKGTHSFEKALRKEGLSFILECKNVKIAREYEEAGADCISVLTEPKWFLGKNEYLKEITEAVSIPCIRKDFTVDEYMIYEARTLGASAVLLICSILSKGQIEEYLGICDELGIDAIVETHDTSEAEMAVSAGARIIGVNNRNLKDFTVDTSNSLRLREIIPADRIFVSESGIKTPEDAAAVKRAGADAVLIGETLMRSDNKKEALKIL